jgi:hypothetical protein
MKKPSRVFWTDAEKAVVLETAAELLAKRSDLSGLPLLREAMCSLPIDRRRKLIAVTQAPWFERGLERARRRLEGKRKAVAEASESEPILRAILAELRVVNSKLDTLLAAANGTQADAGRSPGSKA